MTDPQQIMKNGKLEGPYLALSQGSKGGPSVGVLPKSFRKGGFCSQLFPGTQRMEDFLTLAVF